MKIAQLMKVAVILGLIIVVCLPGLCLPGCAKPAPADELKVGISTFGMENFDASKHNTFPRSVSDVMFDALTYPGKGGLKPGVADKWEVAPDGLSWTFYIHKGIKFHNGDDLTAKDVKFSIERYISKDAYYAHMRDMVDHVEAVDDYTVRIYTKGPQPYLWSILSIYVPDYGIIMPKNYIEQNGWDYFQQHPVGSGPFRFVKYVPGTSAEFEAVDNHWRQTPSFKKLTFIQIPDEATRIAMLKTGEVGFIEVGLDGASDLEKAGFWTGAFESNVLWLSLWGPYQPEGAKYPTADLKVRTALSLAINRDEINKTFFHGKSGPPQGPGLLPGIPDVDNDYWAKYAANIYRYDPVAAKQLLTEAGYPNGFSIKLWSFPDPGLSDQPKLMEIIQGYWGNIGVKAEIVNTDKGTYSTLRKAPNLQLVGGAVPCAAAFPPTVGRNLKDCFHSQGVFHLFSNAKPDFDALIDAACSEINVSKRAEEIANLEKTGIDSYTCISISNIPPMFAVGHRVDVEGAYKAGLTLRSGLFMEFVEHGKS